MSGVNVGRVIEGERVQVAAALDELPVGSVVACDDGSVEGLVYHLVESASGSLRWGSAWERVSSESIARHGVPVTVIR